MPVREISDKMASGELTSIRVGGAGAEKEVALTETTDALAAEVATKLDASAIPSPAVVKAAETLTGFDRVDAHTGGKSLGILQYCHSASSGEVHQIGSDSEGTYTKLTGQTAFADGTALADRTLCQYHDADSGYFSYWYKGSFKVVHGAKFIQLASDFKGYVYYDETGELTVGSSNVEELIVRTTLVAYLYINGTSGELVWYADERHGIVMDGQTHLQQHQNSGFFIAAGLDITGLVDAGTTFTSISAGAAGDEDIKMTFAQVSTMSKLYKEGTSGEWRITDNDNKLAIFRTAKACYNLDTAGTWSLSEIDLDYVSMVGAATNNKLAPVVLLVGQELYADRTIARNKTPYAFYTINAAGLPSSEIHPIFSFIVTGEATGELEEGTDGEIYVSCKKGFPVPIFS